MAAPSYALIDLVIAQCCPVLIMIPCTICLLVTTGNLDKGCSRRKQSIISESANWPVR